MTKIDILERLGERNLSTLTTEGIFTLVAEARREIGRLRYLETLVEDLQEENVTLREELAIKSGYVASLEDEVADYVDEVGALNVLNNDLQTKLDDIYNRTKSNGLVQMGDWFNAKSLKSNET